MSDAVTLANILGSQVSIQWFEAVALVREIADRLLTVSSDRAVPELQQIRLSPEGHVDIVGVVPTDEPVRRMGQLLQALIAHADAPLQLRLVITQATAATPAYQSVRDYSDALGFFERPERSTVLQSLAARVTAVASTASDGAMTLDSLAPLPSGSPDEESPKPVEERRRRRPAWGLAVAAVLILAAAGGAAWYAHVRGIGPQNGAEASALADRASDAMGSAIVHGASAITETLGLGRIVPGKDVDPTPPAPPPLAAAAKPAQPRRRDAPPSAPEAIPAIVAFDLEPTAAEGPGTADPSPSEPATPATPAVPLQPGDEDETIYSVESPTIIPPIGVRPKLARQLPPDFDPNRLGRIELIIGVDGTVESAKLLGPPRTVNDGLFLSVAKAWMFTPALKNGLPVRYRKTIWVASP